MARWGRIKVDDSCLMSVIALSWPSSVLFSNFWGLATLTKIKSEMCIYYTKLFMSTTNINLPISAYQTDIHVPVNIFLLHAIFDFI